MINSDQTLQYRLERYQRLIEISQDLASTLDLDALLKRIIHLALDLSGGQAASILIYDETNRQLTFQSTTNMDEPSIRGISVPLEGSIAGWAVLHQEIAVVDDVHQDARFYQNVEKTTHFPTSNLVAVPLMTKGKVLGVLETLNKSCGQFTEEDLVVLKALGAQAAVAIENTRLFQQSDLIAELVHEIRTPLASLSTASYLLQRPEISDEQRFKLSATIHTETVRLNEMASSFLDLARLESGRVSFHPKVFDLAPLMEECRSVIQSRADEAHIQIRMEIPPELPRLEADRDKIKQVILNLLSNALKYNRPNGSIFVTARASAAEMSVAVRDTGVGIPPEDLNRLFEKFYRVRGSEKIASGTGLGLSICKHIVNNHHGRIEVNSQLNEGSTFTMILPLKQS